MQVHYVTQDEPNFPKLLKEAYEEALEKKKVDDYPALSHERIAKAAWQFENAIFHTEWARYPEDTAAARQQHFKVMRHNKLYYKAIVALVILTFCEVPPWCHERSPTQDIWSWVPPGEWCHVPNGGNPYLSNIWYIPPGVGLIIELVIEIIILRKFLLNLNLDQQHFRAIGTQYFDHSLVVAGLLMAVGSMLDTLVFTFARMPIRFTWIFRTGLLFILPGVQRVYTLIFNKRMIGEFASVAVFFVGTVMFFAWVTVIIFKDLNAPAFKEDEEIVPANKGLSTLREATYSLFVAGIGEGFVSNFLPSFFTYRLSGVFWLIFLVIGQILLLNLVIDAFVAAYLKGSEEELDRKASAEAQSMHGAFKTLSAASSDHRVVPEETFLEFVEDLGKSPRMFPIARETAELLLEHFGDVTEEKFLDACRVFQNPVWATPKDSFIKHCAPGMWNQDWFVSLRHKVWEPKELPAFDVFMNNVLLANLVLVLLQSAYNLNDWGPQPDAFRILDLIFAFAYVGEVIIKLSVKSWAEYCSFWANKFDFFTTWLLLATTVLPYLPFATVQADLKHYANILRLLRLIRVVKQLKQFPRVQFMVRTISRMVNAAGDILQLLGVLLFFFSALSMNLWGGVLYEGQPALKELDYGKKHLYVFNFNDMSMAFTTFFAQLLSEYVPENADALQAASSWGDVAWYVFPAFYLLGVAIIFEITKAFTIEYYLAIKEEAEDEEENEEEEKPSQVREELEAQLRVMDKLQSTLEERRLDLHYTMKNDSFKFQHALQKAYDKCLGPSRPPTPPPNGHHH
ncbi:TPC1 [Symbiodinium natans]|uniref:TPC1 protein n=1 Tax=Symbiodinium natans TaxID=878477 RepID=A0A812JMG3_9DINO|nr:TPC1 [Symbiodinium natans]